MIKTFMLHAELNQSCLTPLINVHFTLSNSSTDSKDHQLGHEHMQTFQTSVRLPANIIQIGSQWYWSL